MLNSKFKKHYSLPDNKGEDKQDDDITDNCMHINLWSIFYENSIQI